MNKFDPTFKKRPLSWSQLSAFAWSKEQWYDRYILGIKSEQTPALLFGDLVDKRIQSDPKFFPEIPRYEHLQFKVTAKFGKMHLVGIMDTYDSPYDKKDHMGAVRDYKTGAKKWTQDRADETGQLTFYALLLWQSDYKLAPHQFRFFIDWIPTQENGDFSVSHLKGAKVQHFETKRTMQDVLKFGQYINATVKEMAAYAKEREVIHMR